MMSITILHYLILAAIIFCLGVYGVVAARKNLISIFLSIELIFLSSVLVFIAFSQYWGNLSGQVFALFILGTAAAEISVGLAILLMLFRDKQSVQIDQIRDLNK